MQFPDYTKIEWFEDDYAICPNCGQLLKTKTHNNGPDLYDCDAYYGTWDTWQTCRCKDCKISGDGSNSQKYSLKDPAAWKFPKNYEVTATQKQNNYIKFLAEQVGIYFNYIANKEVAGALITQLLSLYTKKQQKEMDTDRRADLFKSLGYVPNGENNFIRPFGNSQIIVQIEYKGEEDKERKLICSFWQRSFKPEEIEDLLLAINSVKADLQTLEYKLPRINKTTPEEAAKKIEDVKAAFKKHCERDDIDEYDYDYDDAPDFGDLC